MTSNHHHHHVSLTIAEREAELAALQAAFDEYITSSRELEEELDAELGKMQEKLSQSAAANAALSEQLKHISPQLTQLEQKHAETRAKLQKESQLRRNAEMLQEDAEAKCRELEMTCASLKEEMDALHEGLAFKDSELEETRLEVEVERQRHCEEMEELRSDLSVQQQQQQQQQTNNGSKSRPSDEDVESLDITAENDYVKRLEDELEVVTEQLIETEQRLTKTQEMLQEETTRAQRLQVEVKAKEDSIDESLLLELKEQVTVLQQQEYKYKEQVGLLQEELSLTLEELKAAEQDAKHFQEKVDDLRATHRDAMNALQKEMERAVTDSNTYSSELEMLEQTLQATTQETVSLKQENDNLQRALENAKEDSAAVLQELEEVNARFDQVREEAERVGYDKATYKVRQELLAEHEQQVAELQRQFSQLEAANADLQKTVDIVETALAAERDKQNAFKDTGPSEVEETLKSQLERTKEELEKKTRQVDSLKLSLEGRVAKAEEDVTRLEKELSTTKGKLAEAEANLIVIRREKERAAAAASPSRARRAPRIPDDESRDDVGRLSGFSSDSTGAPRRARSMSPTTPEQRQYRASEEEKKAESIQQEYDELKKQHKMSEAHIKRLEEDLKALQMQLFSSGGDTAVATQMSRISSTMMSPRKDDLMEMLEGSEAVEEVIRSRDTDRIAEELRKIDKKSAMQREHNAQLLSKILSLQGNIQVCCRVRPLRISEIQQGSKTAVEAFSETEVGCFDARANKWKSFGFDKVWGPDQSQNDVFQDVEPLALSVVDGYNACIFAYGQTGSGKTYTMEGLPDGSQYGISYRTIQKIFTLLNFRQQQQKAVSALGGEGQDVPFKFSLEIGMLEIYNDEIFDLLSPVAQGSAAEKKREARMQGEKATLDIRRSADGRIEVPDLTKEPVNSIQDVMDLLKKGNSNRATACTNLNEHSSRSHMVLLVDVTSGLEGQPSNKGCLYLVDLAGSERVRKSQVEGDQLKEAGFINKSLSALGNVMEALDRKASHVPYRDSKLTYLLQDSLGGNSRTMMVVAVCPVDTAYDESVHALNFATRVRRIQLGTAQRNVTSKNLEETVKALTNEMKMLTKAKEKSEHQLHSLKRDNNRIQERLQSISKSRAKQQSDSRTLEVLRKNNQEMANRWQKEKSLREASANEFEKLQSDLERVQKQFAVATRENKSLKTKLEEMESALKASTSDLRRAKDASSAATLRARTAQLMSNRNGASRTPNRSPGIPTGRTPSTSEADPAKVREKVLALLEKYDKGKVDRIDIIMEKFKGKEGLLLEKMTQRYEGGVSSSLQQRSEIALARHKERMQKQKEQQ